jgi:glycosyltransferase involved in cell wall biosynthesis
LRILLVSQMYPGPGEPDFGVFVEGLETALRKRGHEIERAVVDSRRGGKARYVTLAREARRAARAFRPDVVYAHFLVPAGLIAALSSRAPLVVTAHGQDVANAAGRAAVRRATRWLCGRAAAVVAVSDYLRTELERAVPEARGKTEVVDCGVDVERFAVVPPPDGPPAFAFVGTLTERKNVVRLADAFAPLGDAGASLTIVGDGPLRPALEGRRGVTLVGAVPHDRVRDYIAAARVVCQPSVVEPFGQALLEAMAMGRSVVATNVGGPREFVTDQTGVLVDPLDVPGLTRALATAAALPCPNAAARTAAEGHDVRRQAERIEAILERAVRSSAAPSPGV